MAAPWKAEFWQRLGRHELGLLLSVVSVAGLLWAFIGIAEEVAEGGTHAFDRAVLLALRTAGDPADPVGPPWLENVARDVTALGGNAVLTLITVAVVGYLLMLRLRGAALLVLASVGGGTLAGTLLKLGFDRARPDLVPHGDVVYTASFPSGHAMLSAVVYLTLGALLARVQPRRRLKAYVLVLALMLTGLVGCSRVYLGVHWPTDVLAGWTVGAAWAAVCWMIAERLQRRGAVERDTDHPCTAGRDGDPDGG